MTQGFRSILRHARFSICSLAVFGTIANLPSAPLLHSMETSIQLAGRTRSMATDGTNVVAAVYAPSSGMVGAVFISTNETPLERYNIRQSGSPPYVAFNGTNYLLAWTESPGDSAELRGQFIDRSFNFTGPQFVLMSGISAQ